MSGPERERGVASRLRVGGSGRLQTSTCNDALLNNPAFPSPTPPLQVFAEHIAAFKDAETKAASKAKGAASLRDARRKRSRKTYFTSATTCRASWRRTPPPRPRL